MMLTVSIAVVVGLFAVSLLLIGAIATGRYLDDRGERKRAAGGPCCTAYVFDPKTGRVVEDVARRQMAVYEQLIAQHYPEPQTSAARLGHELHRAFAEAAEDRLWTDLETKPARAGSPRAIRELLDGLSGALSTEAAGAAIRGDDRNARALVMLEETVRDARDAIIG